MFFEDERDYHGGFKEAAASLAMTAFDPVLFHQLPTIRQIVLDETWLEAERRGCCVLANDRVVRDNVCLVVLRIGAQLRESALQARNASPETLSRAAWLAVVG